MHQSGVHLCEEYQACMLPQVRLPMRTQPAHRRCARAYLDGGHDETGKGGLLGIRQRVHQQPVPDARLRQHVEQVCQHQHPPLRLLVHLRR